jgi:hypothetical protein
LDALDEIRVDLAAAVDWALDRDMTEMAAGMVTDLALFWVMRGRHGESLSRVRQALVACRLSISAVLAGTIPHASCTAGSA